MSTIVTRYGKGSPLTWLEVDNNFTNLNTDKIQSGDTVAALTITSATINGGTINGTTIGASTASSGVFTSLSDSGNLTFTGTGNRITGDFTNATLANRVFVQTSTTNAVTPFQIMPNGTATISGFDAYNNSDPTNSSLSSFQCRSTETRIAANIAGTGTYLPMTFYTGGSERMRIDTSGKVGIGTTSPQAGRIHTVNAAALAAVPAAGTYGGPVIIGNDNTAYGLYLGTINSGNSYIQAQRGDTATTYNLLIQPNGGNVGIGTTSPSALLNVSNASAKIRIGLDASSAYLDIYRDSTLGGSIYNAAQASPYGYHVFQTAGTERMRIDSSGNVGIGTSSPSTFPGKLAVIGDGIVTDYDMISRVSSSLSNADRGFKQITDGSGEFSIYSPNGGGCVFGIGSSYTERMRIDSSGNVGIGTTSPSVKLDVNGEIIALTGASTQDRHIEIGAGRSGNGNSYIDLIGDTTYNDYGTRLIRNNSGANANSDLIHRGTGGLYINVFDAGYIALKTTDTERMRIDSSGNVLVGTTTQSDTAKVTVKQTAGGSNYGISFVDSSSNTAWIGSGGGPGLYFRSGAGNPVGTLNASGNFVDASDIAYKENILPIQYGLDTVLNLSPKQYLVKANGINAIGFIAQDIEKIIPELVSGEEGSKGISYGQLTAVLAKAIQEQQTIINDLKARIETLEGK